MDSDYRNKMGLRLRRQIIMQLIGYEILLIPASLAITYYLGSPASQVIWILLLLHISNPITYGMYIRTIYYWRHS